MTRANLFALTACALILLACGDHLADEDTPVLQQYVFASTSMYSEDIPNYYDPIGDLYVEQGQSIRFYAGYSVGGKIHTDEALQQYYGGLLWKIGDDYYNLNSFRYTFDAPGEIEGSLETTDIFDDTLRNTFRIHVNTPSAIAIQYPYNGFNQADPTDDQELPLRWNVSGIDSWEAAQCLIYMSYDPDSVWDELLGQTDCFTEVLLRGSLIQDYDSVLQQSLSPYDSSFTLYWGIKMLVKSESGRVYRDSTEIFHFSTKILNDTSTLKIPIVYDRYRDNAVLSTKVTLISAEGDTLQTLTNEQKSGTLSAKVKPQMGLTVVVQETLRHEYISETRTVDIPKNTVLTLDTVTLKDHTPPQAMASKATFDITDSVLFLVYDDGSGVNPSKLHVVEDLDTLESYYQVPYLHFRSTCRDSCKLQIVGEDYSHNSIPKIYWTIENKKSYFRVTGPFREGAM